jgi:hypothetical protein
MICILAGNKLEAQRFAQTQEWDKSEWFCPLNKTEIMIHKKFHTLVIGTFWNSPVPAYAEDMYRLAKIYGYKE